MEPATTGVHRDVNCSAHGPCRGREAACWPARLLNRQFVPLDVPWQGNCSFGVIDTTTGAMAKLPGNGEI